MALWAKKPSDDDPAATGLSASHGQTESVSELAATLDRLGRLLDDTNRKVVDYLATRESRSGEFGTDTVRRLAEQVDRMAARLESMPAGGGADRAPITGTPAGASAGRTEDLGGLAVAVKPLDERLARVEATILAWVEDAARRAGMDQVISDGLGQLAQRLDQQQQSLNGALGHVWQRLDDGLRELVAILRPAQEEPSGVPAGNGQWQHALLGPELASSPDISTERDQFLAELLQGHEGAQALAGQLLVFHSTPMERMPQMLKDVGEAYYRWRPKTRPGAAPMERALATWLEATCDGAGIGNRIELVDPGERFDATRHNAAMRGVEITEVLGWIVLRDNGRVYTKATVAVR
ncbi:MAG: hypothetical protein U1E05_10340 [Patescibacteria group bacterium]|nr:hypothetical protein [Patescibacteria group bacterium]